MLAPPAMGNLRREGGSSPAPRGTMPFWNRSAEAAPQQEGKPMGFSKREDSAPPATTSGDLLLGAGAEFEGKLTFAGTVRIDAKFKGTIVTDDVLVVGDRARIDADITCGTVIVYGEVNGNVRAKTAVELHAPARLRGDVETPSFSMEKGVVFQGQSTMPAEKTAAVARPAPAARSGSDVRSTLAPAAP
jgi:cytoskeletal protein CcmA (bactofilin family)